MLRELNNYNYDKYVIVTYMTVQPVIPTILSKGDRTTTTHWSYTRTTFLFHILFAFMNKSWVKNIQYQLQQNPSEPLAVGESEGGEWDIKP